MTRKKLSSTFVGLLLVSLVIFAGPSPAPWAHHAEAPCPASTPPSSDPPSSTVVVTILSVRPNSDLEGGDGGVPFYDNHADVYGAVVIDGEEFDLPKIEESDFPHWDGQSGRFQKEVSGSPVHLSIRIREADGGGTGDDDVVDINPIAGKDDLDLMLNLCDLRLSGDITPQGIQQVFEISGGSAGEDATIRFKVELADGRPVTTDDLAVVELDLIQVIPNADRLVANKPTIAMVRVANNFPFDISTSLRLRIIGTTVIRDDVFPITPALGPGEVRVLYLYRDDPLTLPSSSAPYNLVAQATIDPDGVYSADYPPEDCRHVNDTTGRVPRKVVTTGRRVLTWAKVGTLLDIPNLASDTELDEIRELGSAYIEATYPVRTVHDEWPVPVIPPASAALDWLVSVFVSLKIPIPADSALPFWLVFELNHIAGSLGIDRLMGVLPTRWFDRFSYDLWKDVPGLSLVESAPHAVIFVARHGDSESSPGPAMTLPAHELGHTYGLSVDARLKENWVCNIDWPELGDLPCGAVGGFDEYKNEDPELQDGNPSRGYWIRRGDEPDAVVPLTDQAQCNSHCFMGNSPENAHLNWANDGRWIDPADYSRLIDKLTPAPDPAVVYLSGMIASDDRVYLGPFYQLPEGVPDRNESSRDDMYAIRFVGSQGLLLEIGLPLNYNSPDVRRPLPITFFGFFAPFPTDTQRIQIWNRRNGRLLAERLVSSRSPEIQLVAPTNNPVIRASDPWDIRWARRDGDGGILTTSVLMSTNGREWWPVAYRLSGDNYRVAAQTVPPGRYLLKLMVNDEIHVTETQPITLTIQP